MGKWNPADRWANWMLGKHPAPPLKMPPVATPVQVVLTKAAQQQQKRWRKPGIGA